MEESMPINHIIIADRMGLCKRIKMTIQKFIRSILFLHINKACL